MKEDLITIGRRSLAYTEFGLPDGDCLFFFHGAPMSRLQLVPLEKQFAAEGLRVLAPERPGYGLSSPQTGRSMADWAIDVATLADHLGIGRFAVAGHSSGGPYAVACAALLPNRVTAALVLSGVTNMAWPGAWVGYPEAEVKLMRMSDEYATIAACVELYGADGSIFLNEPFDLPDPDGEVLADPAFEQAMREAFRQGVGGYAQDLYLQGRPWPFDPGGITIPVDLVHGDQDQLLPIAHSCHTAELIPGASFRTIPGHGHLSILAELPWLAGALVRSAGT